MIPFTKIKNWEPPLGHKAEIPGFNGGINLRSRYSGKTVSGE